MSDNIKVVVKVRPLISREIEAKQQHQWRVDQNTLSQIDSSGRNLSHSQVFVFDKVYSENTQTSDVYNDVAKPIVEAAVAGFNGTIFAYGQTSSGKTYTMTGNDEYPGIIPLAVLNLFKSIKNIPDRDFVVSVSYIEIYNDTVRDLLDLQKTVKVQETYDNSVKVLATDEVTASPEEVLEAMKKGNVNRQTGSTNMNESSSRSHSIFQINIESRVHIEGEAEAGCVNVSQLNLVDLAGSERAGQTGATGIRFKEGTLINKSLTSLALVIKQLSEDSKHVNYRDSKLTRILQNSLGGNAKTSIICAVTPAALEETVSTLQFATRAKTIKNKPEVNAVATDATMIQKLTKELSKLQSQLEEKKKNLEVVLETKTHNEQDLQKKIANLQRFILNGFGQRPNVEQIDGARRKKAPSRRITISTTSVLHPIVEDSPKQPTRKFCTPSLKYNPASIEIPTDLAFVPIQRPSKLGSLPEEPPRLVTPPPNNRRVNFDAEIIKLDSDDDEESTGTQSCSPYHDCYGATNKTPPCVLRKNAALAEKNLEELIELTDREKMYPPDVVELLKQLDKSYTKSAELQDEVEILRKTSQEKDLEIETLRSKINNTEEELKSLTSITAKLETQSEFYNTQLTEWEVKYETQKYKAKLREEELLSLIEDKNIKPYEDIGKMPFKPKDREIIHFMDMSKDISLVNSDNESSITQHDDESSECRSVQLNDMQAQLKSKNDLISDLELKITSQRQQIESLEKSSHDLLNQVTNFKEKLSYFENENITLQSSVNELNSTVKIQKESMELGQNDIKSYISIIQELQIKVTEKDNLLNLNANDEVFEKLLATEEKTIANNENLKNIIHSLKSGLENSKKEIDLLKTKRSSDNEETVKMLRDDIAKLQKQSQENVVTINTLTREKTNLATIEQEFVNKIAELEQKNSENSILIKEQAYLTDFLKNENESSNKTNESLLKQIGDATKKVLTLEEEIQSKDILITNLNTQINEYQVCVDTAKLGISKLQNVLFALTGEAKEIPLKLDSFVIIYNTLNDKLGGLETIAQDTVSQKEKALKELNELQQEITEIVTKHNFKVAELTENIENLNKKVENLTSDIKLMIDKNSEQSIKIEELKLELIVKNNVINKLNLQAEINNQNNVVNSEKDLVINSLQKTERELSKTIEKLNMEALNYITEIKSKEEIIHELRDRNTSCAHELNKLGDELNQKERKLIQSQQRLDDAYMTTDLLIDRLTKKISDIIENIMEKNPSFEYKFYEIGKTQEQLFHFLERISNYISMQSPIFIENEKLTRDLELISHNNKSLKVDLIQSSELLQKVIEELKNKSVEISAIEHKTKEYQGQFGTFSEEMKEQMRFLQLQNNKLKAWLKQLNKETNSKISQSADDETYYHNTTFIRSSSELNNDTKIWSPPSLLTICCNRISKALDSKQNEASDTTSSTNKESSDTRSSEYDELLHELSITQQENITLMTYIEQLEIENKALIIERVQTQSEVRQLLEEAEELQKKLFNHRTILSILTATTYTENTSLKSQLKGLQHHHSRFHNVCQRDIPELKKELDNLMSILKNDSDKRYSLPILRNNSINNCASKNDSTLDGDVLMLDTNVTVTTADNTLVDNLTCLDYTQIMFNETGCQILDHNCTDSNLLSGHLAMEIEVVKKENEYLKKKIRNESKVDVQCSPIKIADLDQNKEAKLEELLTTTLSLKEQLAIARNEKEILETRYHDLVVEIPSINTLVEKIKVVEDQLKAKQNELVKVAQVLQDRNKKLSEIQEENDSLSTEIMEHVLVADNLSKEVEKLRLQNIELNAQCQKMRDDNDDNSSTVGEPTVKQLNKSSISMDLDESLNFEMAHDSVPCSPQSKKCNMSDIQEERPVDLYMVEKNECYNFYMQEIGKERENLPNNATIIEIMKNLHTTLVTKHGNEVENLVNKLKDHEESQIKLRNEINDMNASYLNLKNELEEKDTGLSFINNVITQLRDNLIGTKECRLNFEGLDKSSNLFSVKMLENVSNHTNKIVQDYNTLNEVLSQTKCQLSEKENECNSLKAVNEKIQEINKAVTLDIIQKEQDINKAMERIRQNLLDVNMITIDQFPMSEPVNVQMLIHYLQHFVKEYQTEKAMAVSPTEINNMKLIIDEKERQIKEMLSNVEVLENRNKEIIKFSKDIQLELDVALKNKGEENDRNNTVIENLTEEIRHLKQTLNLKDDFLKSIAKNITHLSDRKDVEANELLCTIQSMQDENDKLKTINEMISKEAESYASELEKSCAIIAQNNMDLDKMTSEILILRESFKEATAHVDSLKQEVQALTDTNIKVKGELDIKCRDYQRLEINIKTHEKTAVLQSRMINRLQKLKEDDDIANKENLEKLKELSERNEALQEECKELRNTVKSLTEEIEHARSIKEALENRKTEFEDSGRRSRTSIEPNADCSKRRRQSLHDTKRLFDKLEEHKNLEAVFASRQKPDDFFADTNESLSGRSTPLEGGRGRDSLLSRTEHSDKDEDHSRPNSALARATRRRRQSSHDLHRSVTPQADLSHFVINELEEGTTRIGISSDIEITQLKAQLATCGKELEELKIKYRDLDEECEICSQYLQERDEQCSRLKKEKTALEKEVAELKSKPFSNSFNFKMKPSVANVSVNTDEDWANLHSVVVDRMSYDAEVEKNKKLNKMVEELRFKKLDLKKIIDKMQKALERKDNSRELDHAKQELRSCKAELEGLRQKYKELDEECETCAGYLKEREEQCRQLKETRAELEARLYTAEAKIQELHEKAVGEHSKSVRKKRQTVHDMNRPQTSAVEQMDATTETTYDGQRDNSINGADKHTQILHLKKFVETLSMQKARLEDQLRMAYPAQPICVATGSAIVQNQQISDVMKENQRLKTINAKLVNICKKRGKSANRENEDPYEQG